MSGLSASDLAVPDDEDNDEDDDNDDGLGSSSNQYNTSNSNREEGGLAPVQRRPQLLSLQRSSSRTRSRQRRSTIRHGSDSEDENAFGPMDEEDDEVVPQDRGEELVRRRMKARKRARARQQRSQSIVSAPSTPANFGGRDSRLGTSLDREDGLPSPSLDREGRPTFIPLPGAMLSPEMPQMTSPGPVRSPATFRHSTAPGFLAPRRRESRLEAGDERSQEEEEQAEDNDEDENEDEEDQGGLDDSDSTGDGEYTLKDRQDAINIEHPFGLPIWKPALYKKSRTVTRNAEAELHSRPSRAAERHLLPGNILWSAIFGWWLCLLCLAISLLLGIVPVGGHRYARVARELGGYLFWPFGKYVEAELGDGQRDGGEVDADASRQENEEGERPVSTYTNAFTPVAARFPHDHEHHVAFNARRPKSTSSASERTPLNGNGVDKNRHSYGGLSETSDDERVAREQRIYEYVFDGQGRDVGRGERWIGVLAWGLAFWLVLAPLLGIICLVCWAGVVTIPMAKLSWVLLKNLARHPLALHFGSERVEYGAEQGYNTAAGQASAALNPSPRTNILLCTYRALGGQYYKYTVGGVNILFVNTLPIVGFTIVDAFLLPPQLRLSQPVIFVCALGSVIPLSYFIGMAVASVSAQSSIGMGAVINATFGSVIEILLYGIALTQGKGRLVEGSIIGSILAGVLLMPGLSMCSGATRRKEQRFNARSAGVTSTMLIMAIIGILTPTLFYQIYGTFQLTCTQCPSGGGGEDWTCKRCFYEHVPPATDPFYQGSVKGLMYTCTVVLVLSYGVGLWFSLRTHASTIWQNPQTVPDHHLRNPHGAAEQQPVPTRPTLVTHPSGAAATQQQRPARPPSSRMSRLSIHRRDYFEDAPAHGAVGDGAVTAGGPPPPPAVTGGDHEDSAGGHEAPSWSRTTSVLVLLACTVLYAAIAEVLVDAVDVVLVGIDEKFLGVTLFALVPNTTEFMNAMSFAMNGNIALSMEIGSAYALQVCLIQIPAMVAWSALSSEGGTAFTLIFPRWDVIAIIFAVFLLTYTYIEARSNYYRGSILVLSYCVLVAGFYFAPITGDIEAPGDGGPETLQVASVGIAAGARAGAGRWARDWLRSLFVR